MKIGSYYLDEVFRPHTLKALVREMSRKIELVLQVTSFDALAFRGTSGAALAFPLSYELGMPLVHVRKEGISSHYTSRLEGNSEVDIRRYAIIDDFISTGATINAIIDAMYDKDSCMKCVAVFIYNRTEGAGERQFVKSEKCGPLPIYYPK